jgi:uncharacterized ferredoxin-like protein
MIRACFEKSAKIPASLDLNQTSTAWIEENSVFEQEDKEYRKEKRKRFVAQPTKSVRNATCSVGIGTKQS